MPVIKSKYNWKNLIYIVGALRIISPFFVFAFPLQTAVLNIFLLDGVDGLVFSSAGLGRRIYEIYDKLTDYWWYGFIVLFFLGSPLFSIFLVLYIFRGIGQLINMITKKEIWLFYFPAVIEIFFIMYLVSSSFSGFEYLFKDYFIFYSIIIAVIISIIREYIIHIAKRSIGKLVLGIGPKWSK